MKAQLRHLRISPRKVRLVADLIRGKNTKEAKKILKISPQKSAGHILKLLESAIANAGENQENLVVSEIRVDQGPTLKRWRARAFGRAAEIKKRTSHIIIILNHGTESSSGRF